MSHPLAEAIARDMRRICDDEFIQAVEAACITQHEYDTHPSFDIHNRVRAALEEFYCFELGVDGL